MELKIHLRYLVMVVAILLYLPTITYAQRSYASPILQRMAQTLHVEQLCDTLPQGLHLSVAAYNGKPLTVLVGTQEVMHIGYTLFPAELRPHLPQSICNFLERYALQMTLPLKRAVSVQRQLEVDEVRFLHGSLQTLTGVYSDSTLSFSYNCLDNKEYVATWSRNGTPIVELCFPVSYELLLGMDIQESQQILVRNLRRISTSHATEANQVSKSELVKLFEPNYYVLQGDSCFVANLNSNRYYREEGNDHYNLVFSESYPVESFANLFTGDDIENEIQAHLKVIVYDSKPETVQVPLVGMLQYFKERGCKNYFGVIDKQKDEITAELLIVNHEVGYCHSLRIICRPQSIATRNGIVDGRMSCFIPLTKIRFLFQENNK